MHPPPSIVKPTVEGDRVLSTLNADGSRRWIKPRPSPGRFLASRRFVAYFLIALFATLPFIKVAGKPIILLDLPARRFTIFTFVFHPTDTLLLALFMVGVFLTIFLLTALLGRVWCGWACPQTVYMEFLFRPIERLFEGTPGRAKKGLAKSGGGAALKYVVYLLASLFVAHVFLAYFVGVDRLLVWMTRSPLEHPSSFILVALVTAAMMFDFSFFREQVCIVACPYGRFQSVLLDRKSLIVAYDRFRGEPRGKGKRTPRAAATATAATATPAPALGDCIDCHMCVTTCPTGIDIRDGLQMECIHCAQCIDACDAVMDKVGLPRGLIRYSSQDAMADAAAGVPPKRRFLRPRVVLYPLVLLIVATLFLIAFSGKGVADVTVLRAMGKPFAVLPSGEVANTMRVKIVNRLDAPAAYTLSASLRDVDTPLTLTADGGLPVLLKPQETRTVPVTIVAPAAAFAGSGSALIQVRITGGGDDHNDKHRYDHAFTHRLLGPVRPPAPAADDDDERESPKAADDDKEHDR